MPTPLEKLEAERVELLARLGQIGDMRRGSITETYRRCGKSGCQCAGPKHPGHGPFYAYTYKVGGKTKTLQLRPGLELSKLEREVKNYRQFRRSCQRLLEVNEAICQLRPVAQQESDQWEEMKKKLRKPSRRSSQAR